VTRIDFYILRSDQPMERLRTACRIAEKAFLLGHDVHIHTADPALSQRMDELLWTFRDRSFVPHEVEPEDPAQWPVTIGHAREPEPRAVLINLAEAVPPFFGRFERVAEVVDAQPEVKAAGRARYRFYRERGYPLHHHDLG
jgi:DNA polymerase-3 subunit chi